jgi:hypothetical protein
MGKEWSVVSGQWPVVSRKRILARLNVGFWADLIKPLALF